MPKDKHETTDFNYLKNRLKEIYKTQGLVTTLKKIGKYFYYRFYVDVKESFQEQNPKDVSVFEISKEYDRIYTNKPGNWGEFNTIHSQTFFDLLNVEEPKEKKFLDVACGCGDFLILAKEKGFDVYGIDISQVAIEQARQKLLQDQLKLSIMDGSNMKFKDEYFDVVTCIGSLEHFPDPVKGASEFARVIKQNGIVLIVVPNNLSYGFFKKEGFRKQGDQFEWHLTQDKWKEILNNGGLIVKKASKDFGVFMFICEKQPTPSR